MKTPCKVCGRPAKFYCLACGQIFYCKLHPCAHISPEQVTDITPIESFPSLKIHVAELLRRKQEARRWGAGCLILAALLGLSAVFALTQRVPALAGACAVLAVGVGWWGYSRLTRS
jgi:hypothetical protein